MDVNPSPAGSGIAARVTVTAPVHTVTRAPASTVVVSMALLASLTWRRASVRARGAWVSFADICQQIQSNGRLANLRLRRERTGWCRMAGVGAGDLRALVEDGLATYAGDDLMLAGWSREPEPAPSTAAMRARAYRVRQALKAGTPRVGGVLVVGDLTPDESIATSLGTGRDERRDASQGTTAHSVTGHVTNPVTLAVTNVTAGVTNVTPHAFAVSSKKVPSEHSNVRSNVRFDDNHERSHDDGDQLTTSRSNAHTCASQADVRHAERDEKRDESRDGENAQPQPHTDSTHVSQNTYGTKPLPHLVRANRASVRSAVLANEPLRLITVLGATVRGRDDRTSDLTDEWLQAFGADDARIVLAICCCGSELPRLPSRYRALADRWRSYDIHQRRLRAHDLCAALDLPTGKRLADGTFSSPRFIPHANTHCINKNVRVGTEEEAESVDDELDRSVADDSTDYEAVDDREEDMAVVA